MRWLLDAGWGVPDDGSARRAGWVKPVQGRSWRLGRPRPVPEPRSSWNQSSNLIVVDFDGTITEHDTLVDIVQSHAADLLWQLEDDLDAGRITLRECIEREFAAVRGEHDQIVAEALAAARVRPGFAEFATAARVGGHRVVVVSSGFESIIRPVLEHAGVDGVEVVAHEVRFSPQGSTVEFRH